MTIFIRDNGRDKVNTVGGIEFQRGPRGPQGVKGDSAGVSTLMSVGAIDAHVVVFFTDATHVDVADANTLSHAQRIQGVNTTLATGAEQALRVVMRDRVHHNAWSWIPGQPVFCGAGGVLTQVYDPNWAFVCIVGVAITADTLDINVRHSIL